ncbi:hypothetical protein BH11PSE11_BH11PSE11_20430 [soil metagenome]
MANRDEQDARQSPWWKKLGWLVLLWGLSVGALGAVAYLLGLLMRAAGLRT